MSEAMSKNWFNYILAGRRHIEKSETRDGTKYFRVTKSAKSAINEHYKGQCFFYRNDWSNKLNDLLLSMTETVRKYGVKLLVVDNLMTIDMDANADNELLKQTDVINKLIRFAIKFQVAVVLVAHPRKLQTGESIGLYSVSGSSNIINLSHRAISLKRVTKKEKAEGCLFDVKVGVLKDRIAGRITNEVGLHYDAMTRRFYSNKDEFAYQYSWDTNEYNDELDYPMIDNDADREVFGASGQ
jgi:hypothetical protein